MDEGKGLISDEKAVSLSLYCRMKKPVCRLIIWIQYALIRWINSMLLRPSRRSRHKRQHLSLRRPVHKCHSSPIQTVATALPLLPTLLHLHFLHLRQQRLLQRRRQRQQQQPPRLLPLWNQSMPKSAPTFLNANHPTPSRYPKS